MFPKLQQKAKINWF